MYHELNESNRYWNSSDGTLNCDNNTITSDQWYRFTGDAGTLMAPECVPMGSCNTFAPGWINGTHPANDYQLVSRNVCVHMQDICCFKSYPVDIRNCSGYYVYKLKSPDVCYVRYCGMRGEVSKKDAKHLFCMDVRLEKSVSPEKDWKLGSSVTLAYHTVLLSIPLSCQKFLWKLSYILGSYLTSVLHKVTRVTGVLH